MVILLFQREGRMHIHFAPKITVYVNGRAIILLIYVLHLLGWL